MTRDHRSLPVQLRDQILALIERDGLGAGDQLPTEAEIAKSFDVARTTVREAFKLLEQDRIIDVRHGLGRYISQLATLDRPITRLESVTEMMRSRGYKVTNRVVSVQTGPADQADADALAIPAGTEVIRLERVRLHKDDPLIYSVDIFPKTLVGERVAATKWSGSLLDILEARGIRVVSAGTQIKAVRLPAEGLKAIGRNGTDATAPWILMVQRHIDDEGRPVILSHDYYRGDRFTFNVVRQRQDVGRGELNLSVRNANAPVANSGRRRQRRRS
jgi:GntR family transcriptional regulator